MSAFRVRMLFAAALAVSVIVTAAAASAGESKPFYDTPCDRHDLGPKFPPIKFPPFKLTPTGPVAKPVPHATAVPKPVGRPK